MEFIGDEEQDPQQHHTADEGEDTEGELNRNIPIQRATPLGMYEYLISMKICLMKIWLFRYKMCL